MSKSRWMFSAAVAALLAVPGAMPAQQVTPVAVQEVGTHYGSRARLVEAAREQVSAARALDSADPEAARGLARAGHLFYLAGQSGASLRMLEQSADMALDRGDVVFAANVLLQASAVATKAKNPERGKQLAGRAQLLSTSPLLSDGQRVAILDQIERR